MNKTVEVFLQEMARSARIKEKIIENIASMDKKEMTLNLFDLDFDFSNKQITIYYYVEDKDYPPTIIKNEELLMLFQA
jgi:hypothetical protein